MDFNIDIDPNLLNPKSELGKISDAGIPVRGGRIDDHWSDRLFIDIWTGESDLRPKKLHYIDQNYFINEFNLQYVEFGNWLNQQDRQNFLYNCAVSFEDLAKALGIVAHEIGLQKNLSVAFGARGKGLVSASGHFEKLSKYKTGAIINLTKHYGQKATLAHEYGHALDNIISLATDGQSGYISGGRTTTKSKIQSQYDSGNQFRIWAEEFFSQLYFKADGEQSAYQVYLNSDQATEYTERRIEVFARYFEIYISYLLDQQKIENQFLCYSFDEYLSFSDYPNKEDFLRSFPLFDKIIKTGLKLILNKSESIRHKGVDTTKLPRAARSVLDFTPKGSSDAIFATIPEGDQKVDLIQFEVGKVYKEKYITDSSLIVHYKCIDRSKSFATFQHVTQPDNVKKRKIRISDGVEYVVDGSYSMAPSIYANTIVQDLDQDQKDDQASDQVDDDKVKALSAFSKIKAIVPKDQSKVLKGYLSDSFQLFKGIVSSLAEILEKVPAIYGQEGVKDPIVYFHYFSSSSDWYVTEIDQDRQQAFGYTILNGDKEMAELGYLSIPELTGNRKVELDFYFDPQPLSNFKAKDQESQTDVTDLSVEQLLSKFVYLVQLDLNDLKNETRSVNSYKLGDTYASDFDYHGMLETALKVDVNWPLSNLKKLFNSFEDVNYHATSKHLWLAIEKLKESDQDGPKVIPITTNKPAESTDLREGSLELRIVDYILENHKKKALHAPELFFNNFMNVFYRHFRNDQPEFKNRKDDVEAYKTFVGLENNLDRNFILNALKQIQQENIEIIEQEKSQYLAENSNYPFSINDIDKETAMRAFYNTSFRPERRGESFVQEVYYDRLARLYDDLIKKAVDTGNHEQFQEKFKQFVEKYKSKVLAYLYSHSRVASSMITGPANFPVARNRKLMRYADDRYREMDDYFKKYSKKIIYTSATNTDIKTGKAGSLQLLKDKLERLTNLREAYKQVNKQLRKLHKDLKDDEQARASAIVQLFKDHGLDQYYLKEAFKARIPSYASTNLSANIRRVKEQIAIEEKLNEAKLKGNKEYYFDGGKIILNYEINRIQIDFDEKPPLEVRNFIKKAGQAFKWARSQGVWQRQLNTYYKGNFRDLALFLHILSPLPEKQPDQQGQQSLFGLANRRYNKVNGIGAVEVLDQGDQLDYNGFKPSYQILSDYSHLINEAEGNTKLHTTGGLDETIDLIKSVINSNYHQVTALASHLRAKTVEQTAFNIWEFIKSNINYGFDTPNIEEVRTPARSWADRHYKTDCEDMAIFAGSILKNLGIPFKLQIVGFNGSDHYQHIYIVAGRRDQLVIDPVMSKYGIHPKNITKTMKIQLLSGTSPVNGIVGLAGISTADPVTQKAIARRSAIIRELRKGGINRNSRLAFAAELRKLNYIIDLNGLAERNEILPLMAYIKDIKDNGEFIFKNDEAMQIAFWYFSELQKGTSLETLRALLDGNRSAEQLSGWLKKAWKGIKKGVQSAGDFVKRNIKSAGKDIKNAGGKVVDHVRKGLTTYNPVFIAGRNAYLGLLRLNAFNLAGRIANGYANDPAKVSKIENKWEDLGGKKSSFKSAAMKGSSKKALLAGIDQQLGDGGTVSGLVATAAPIIAVLTPLILQLADKGNVDVSTLDPNKTTGDNLKDFFAANKDSLIQKGFDMINGNDKSNQSGISVDAPAGDQGFTNESEKNYAIQFLSANKDTAANIAMPVLLIGGGALVAKKFIS